MNRIILLTGAEQGTDIAAGAPARILAIPEDTIVETVPPGSGSTDKLTRVRTNVGGYGNGKQFNVLETALQIETARVLSVSDPQVGTLIKLDVASAGTAQGTATALTHYFSKVASGTATTEDGVVLPAATKFKVMVVVNATAFAVDVFPASGEFHSGKAVNVAETIPSGERRHFYCTTAGTWKIATNPF